MHTNKRPSLLTQAHQLLKPHLQEGAIAIDATLGNGHDTLFLAQHLAPSGIVYGFDIQEAALTNTRSRLQQAGLLHCSRLHLSSHTTMSEHIPLHHHGKVVAIMFNLGYLPGADKHIITRSDSTLAALKAAITLLAPGGRLSILAYPGHAGGENETTTVKSWAAELNNTHYNCNTYYSNHPSTTAPRLLVIEKLI